MFEKINNDLKIALKDGDKFTLSVLRMLKSSLQLEIINKKGEASDEIVISVLKKQVKQRIDAKKEYENLGKMDVANDLAKEIEIINKYLPREASEEEIKSTLDEAFEELKPTSMKDMGSIMKYVTAKLANADMTKVSQMVKERLTK